MVSLKVKQFESKFFSIKRFYLQIHHISTAKTFLKYGDLLAMDCLSMISATYKRNIYILMYIYSISLIFMV